MSKEDNENSNYILENFNKFFSQLSQAFPPKDAYKIYSEKALIVKKRLPFAIYFTGTGHSDHLWIYQYNRMAGAF